MNKKDGFFLRLCNLMIRQHKYIQGFGLSILATGTVIPPIKKLILGLGVGSFEFSFYSFFAFAALIFLLLFCYILIFIIFISCFNIDALKSYNMNKEERGMAGILSFLLVGFSVIVFCVS